MIPLVKTVLLFVALNATFAEITNYQLRRTTRPINRIIIAVALSGLAYLCWR